MEDENTTRTWGYRLLAFILVFCSVSCIFSPITTIVDMVADGADFITEWIPGVGCLVDTLTDYIVGIVGCVVQLISCACALSCFLMVAGFVWVFMRPMIGIPLMIVACCCFGGGSYCVYQNKQPKDGRDKDFELHSDDEAAE